MIPDHLRISINKSHDIKVGKFTNIFPHIPRRWYCDVLLLNVILIGNISRFNCYIKKVAFTYELVIFMYDSNPDNAKLLIHCNEPSIKN